MLVDDRHIKRLQSIYHEHYGRELSRADAIAMTHRLVSLLLILMKYDKAEASGGGSNNHRVAS